MNLIPANPGWYARVIVTTREKSGPIQRYDDRPVIAWKVVDAEAGTLLPVIANPSPGAAQPTLVLDMGRDDRRLIYRHH
ncbi:hypothetical protein ACFUAC_01675 [Streptomyces sp. NPDC057148]|uniref:hypothetical protein n=1 Tax=unclassified Streptomyces TaxID=2593676 RepID=UPI0029AC0A6F|nr:hypothetical protein [Streptomyces sp. ME01-18h]MDX3400062.1 hypothetical protein [Streptomyces sp. ME01-18h]